MLDKIKGIISVVLAIFTAVKELVELVEVPKHGEEKKAAVLQGIEIIVDLVGELFLSWLPKDKIMWVAEKAIEFWVGFKNIVGWFKNEPDDILKN